MLTSLPDSLPDHFVKQSRAQEVAANQVLLQAFSAKKALYNYDMII